MHWPFDFPILLLRVNIEEERRHSDSSQLEDTIARLLLCELHHLGVDGGWRDLTTLTIKICSVVTLSVLLSESGGISKTYLLYQGMDCADFCKTLFFIFFFFLVPIWSPAAIWLPKGALWLEWQSGSTSNHGQLAAQSWDGAGMLCCHLNWKMLANKPHVHTPVLNSGPESALVALFPVYAMVVTPDC